MGRELKYYPFRRIRGYLSRFGEMRFGRRPGSGLAESTPSDGSPAGEDSAVIELPPETPAGTTFAFVIDEHLNFFLRSAPGVLCCDWGEIVCEENRAAALPGNATGKPQQPEIDCRIQAPCFVYDKARTFVLGVDPRTLEIWELSPEAVGASIEVEKLKLIRKSGDNGVSGIENINFTIRPAEFVGIYGGSGAGKTTLINRILSPEYHPLSKAGRFWQRAKNAVGDWWAGRRNRFRGNVWIDGELPVKSVDAIAYLPQRVSLPPELTCGEIFSLAATDRGTMRRNEIMKRIARVCFWCALDESILNRRYGVLSGGEKRRAALAVALLRKKTKLLIVDEPTTGLDISSELSVMNALRTISRHGITVVAVTHSVAACRLFDRVLILRKDFSSRRGARLVFNGLWHEDSLPGGAKLSDREILERYTDPDEPEHFEPENRAAEKNETVWPFVVMERSDTAPAHKSKLRFPSIKNILPFRVIYQTLYQTFGWLKTAVLIQWRNRRRLLTFGVLAAMCVAIIQLGTSHVYYINSNVLMITLLTLAASWLCAIFAALVVADQLRFFAWEHFSGLKTSGFVVGMFFSMLPAAALIALIFNIGMFFSINNAELARRLPGFAIEKFAAKPEMKGEIVSSPIREVWKEGANNTLDGFSAAVGKQYQCVFPEKSLFRMFCRTWLTMTLLGLFGCAVGMFMLSLFRDKISSLTAVVVLYIFYLLFSRLLITEGKELLGPAALLRYGISESGHLGATEIGFAVPILLSFLSISRYAFNAIFYSICEIKTIAASSKLSEWVGFVAHEEVVIALFILAILVVMTFLYQSKNRNWRSISK